MSSNHDNSQPKEFACSVWRSGTRHLNTNSLFGLLPALLTDGAGLGLRGIIFDLDGVIVSTEHIHFKAYREVLKAYGIELTQQLYEQHFRSRGRATALTALLPQATQQERSRIGAQKDALFLKHIAESCSDVRAGHKIVFEDALELLQEVWSRKLACAIGTAASNGLVLLESLAVDGVPLAQRFDAIITAKDVLHNKPAPDIYIQCQAALGLPSESLIVIEDSEAGVQAALAAGLWVLQVHR